MKRLDLRTALLVLAAVALGYMICLAMPVAQAECPDVTTIERLVVTDYIEFGNGVQLMISDGILTFSGPIQTDKIIADKIYASKLIESSGYIYAKDWSGAKNRVISNGYIFANDSVETGGYFRGSFYRLGPTTIISNTHTLQGLKIAPSNIGGVGLDVGKLQGHPASDFVLKSETTDEFCQTFCPATLPSKPSD